MVVSRELECWGCMPSMSAARGDRTHPMEELQVGDRAEAAPEVAVSPAFANLDICAGIGARLALEKGKVPGFRG